MIENNRKVLLNIDFLAKVGENIIFSLSRVFPVLKDFVSTNLSKSNNVSYLTKRFFQHIKLDQKYRKELYFSKWTIVFIHFGCNIWTEINWLRPAIVYKRASFTSWWDVIVIPLTSFEENKKLDEFDIIIEPNQENWLKNKSIARLRQIKSISKKRISNIWWKINDEIIEQIDFAIINMFQLEIHINKKSPI